MALAKNTLSINSHKIIDPLITFSRNSTATRVNNIGVIESVAAGVIRQDYESSIARIGQEIGWLLEESSTNLCLQSEDLSTTWSSATSVQTNYGSIGTNAKAAPDGTSNADHLKASTTGTGIVAVKQAVTYSTDSKYTVSIFAQKGNHDYLEITNKDDNATGMTFSQVFNLNTGATGTSGGTVYAAGMKEFPGGWYRCYVTFTAVANSADDVYYKARPDNAVSTTHATTLNSGIYLWGAQVEEKTYMTSYVPTTAATVTRAADVAQIDDTDDVWNMNVGMSIWVHGTPLNTTETVTPIFHYQDSNNTNYVTLLSDGKIKVTRASTSQLSSDPFDTGKALAKETEFRTAMTIKPNRLHLAMNGSLSDNLPDTTINVPAKTDSSDYVVKFFHGTGFSSGSGWIKGFRIYSAQISDDNLQNITFRDRDAPGTVLIGDSGLVAVDSITTDKIAANAVTTAKITDAHITEAKLATDSVTTAKILAGAVDTAELADDAVTNAKIADNSITSAKIAVDVIVAEDLASNSITVAELSNNAVTTAKIDADAVDGTKIADDAIDSEHYTDGSIDLAHLSADSVDGTKIADDAIDSEHYTDGSIDDVHLASSGTMPAWDGSALTGMSTFSETVVTPTANQTVFNFTYTVGKLQVYFNGVKLLNTTDFTASNGTTVVLGTGATVNDKVEFVKF